MTEIFGIPTENLLRNQGTFSFFLEKPWQISSRMKARRRMVEASGTRELDGLSLTRVSLSPPTVDAKKEETN